MREELILLLEEAFEAGIITSTTQSQIDAIKKNMNLSDADYQQIEDQIRLDAYVKKIKEREKKGITFMGDLRKQYKITEDDKPLIQERLKTVAKKASVPKQPEPSKQSAPAATPITPPQVEATKKSEPVKQREQTTPIKKSEPPKKQEVPKKGESKKTDDGTWPLVLVADDNETQLFLTKSILEENNYACVTADSPEIAVRIISEKQPALVICDVNFGIGRPTGLDVYTNIRTKNIQVPFIIMSAFIQKEFKDHAKRIGITEYITKPADPAQLIAVIKKYIPH